MGNYKIFIFWSVALFFLISGLSLVFAQQSSDAIAVRVLPNNRHLSAIEWYKDQKFSGSPQSLKVDGYGAVRDGRTVYVNVSNVNGGNLYTNIYLISYNQQAEKGTSDVFANILKFWRFNSNVNSYGHCRKSGLNCIYDSQCAIGDTCDSMKARITRDTKRLEDMARAKLILDAYYAKNSRYPIFSSGTYIPNASVSTWPSWSDKLAQELGAPFPKDPINKMGPCLGYNEITCWNENTKLFYPGLPDLASSSYAYVFTGSSDGSSAATCAVLESGLLVQGVSVCVLDLCIDNDGDGYGLTASAGCRYGGLDCNDADPDVYAGIPETSGVNCYDGLDNDCDGLVDCDDGDCLSDPTCMAVGFCNYNGFCDVALGETCFSCPSDSCCGVPVCGDGNCESTLECSFGAWPCPGDCYCGNGTIDCMEECDDGNTLSGDGCSASCQSECTDDDGDRHIAENNPAYASCGNVCGLSHNQSCVGYNDCNDSAASIFFGPFEKVCTDSVDDNCQGGSFDGCEPDDYILACQAMGLDYSVLRSPSLRCCGDDVGEGGPYEVTETTCDGSSDNDCDGLDDSVDPDCTGFCGATENNVYVVGDAFCDHCSNDQDDDGDQPGLWPVGVVDACDSDCPPHIANTVQLSDYQATETLCDNIDNDCDGTVDESHPDKSGVCSAGLGACLNSGTWVCNSADPSGPVVCDAIAGTPSTEICGNAVDEDCDGSLDNGCVMAVYYQDADGDGFGNPSVSLTAPIAPAGYVLDNTDCEDSVNGFDGLAGTADDGANINPSVSEICDGLDNNCSGIVDDGLTAPVSSEPGVCGGVALTCGGILGWYLDTAIISGYAAFETGSIYCDGLDNDCDGTVDEGYSYEDCQAVCESVSTHAWVDYGSGPLCCGNDPFEGPYQASEYMIGNDLCADEYSGTQIDNNCDGFANCLDSSCAAVSPNCPTPCTFGFTAPGEFTLPCEFVSGGGGGGSLPFPPPAEPPSP